MPKVLKGKQRQRFGDMGLTELRKTNNFQLQSHFERQRKKIVEHISIESLRKTPF